MGGSDPGGGGGGGWFDMNEIKDIFMGSNVVDDVVECGGSAQCTCDVVEMGQGIPQRHAACHHGKEYLVNLLH